MNTIKDKTGFRNGRLTVVRFDRRENGITWWVCRCDCGREWLVAGCNLNRTHGCIHCGNKTHGLSRTAAYNKWRTALKHAKANGGTVCTSWRNDLPTFMRESKAAEHIGQTLVPVDPKQAIGPYNFRWEYFNPGRSKPLPCNGRKITQTQLAREIGVSKQRVGQLLKKYGSLDAVLKHRRNGDG